MSSIQKNLDYHSLKKMAESNSNLSNLVIGAVHDKIVINGLDDAVKTQIQQTSCLVKENYQRSSI
ncbi:MAG: hypothetical protein OJF59_000387 [Cytophagales bacterium]|jgi:hypothetical protein|nr:hypothetical protein [Bacteroidota bacterium]MBS1981131.1 hypothetical protein [Bacteroidota bacterium]WHZ06634.1 MAG: hypothetical protein OJF59_000387 [Cytophagales bacterium]